MQWFSLNNSENRKALHRRTKNDENANRQILRSRRKRHMGLHFFLRYVMVDAVNKAHLQKF
eukprot:gene1240-2407_t